MLARAAALVAGAVVALRACRRWRWSRCSRGGGAWLRWHKGRGLSADAVIAHAESEFHKADEHYRRAVDELRTRRGAGAQGVAAAQARRVRRGAGAARGGGDALPPGRRSQPADVDAEELLFAAYRKEIRFFEDQMMREQQ